MAGYLLPEPLSTQPIPMDLVIALELEIYGSHGMAASHYPPMMTMVADGTLRLVRRPLLARVIDEDELAPVPAQRCSPPGRASYDSS